MYNNIFAKYPSLSNTDFTNAINLMAREICKTDADAVGVLAIADLLVNGDIPSAGNANYIKLKEKYPSITNLIDGYIDTLSENVWNCTDIALTNLAVMDLIVNGDIGDPVANYYIGAPTITINDNNILTIIPNDVFNLPTTYYKLFMGTIEYRVNNLNIDLENYAVDDLDRYVVYVVPYNETYDFDGEWSNIINWEKPSSNTPYLGAVSLSISNGVITVTNYESENIDSIDNMNVYYRTGDENFRLLTSITDTTFNVKTYMNNNSIYGEFEIMVRLSAVIDGETILSNNSNTVNFNNYSLSPPNISIIDNRYLRIYRVNMATGYEVNVYINTQLKYTTYLNNNSNEYNDYDLFDLIIDPGTYAIYVKSEYGLESSSASVVTFTKFEANADLTITSTAISSGLDSSTLYIAVDHEISLDGETGTPSGYDYVVEGVYWDPDSYEPSFDSITIPILEQGVSVNNIYVMYADHTFVSVGFVRDYDFVEIINEGSGDGYITDRIHIKSTPTSNVYMVFESQYN